MLNQTLPVHEIVLCKANTKTVKNTKNVHYILFEECLILKNVHY